jgi:hypothetical protein
MAVGMDTLAGIAIQAVADHHLPRCASGMRGIAESPPIIDELYLLNHPSTNNSDRACVPVCYHLLPSFQNIRCFSFVKQVNLDIF